MSKRLNNIYVFFFLILYVLALISCSPKQSTLTDKEDQIAVIDSLQKRMVDERTQSLNKELALQGIAAYKKYAQSFPEDTLSAEYLFRLSDIARGIGDYSTALSSLQNITSQYPDFGKIPECYFLQGYYCQEFFHDTMSARVHYQNFLSKYPDHPLANDAKTLIKLLGKTDDEIVKRFRLESK